MGPDPANGAETVTGPGPHAQPRSTTKESGIMRRQQRTRGYRRALALTALIALALALLVSLTVGRSGATLIRVSTNPGSLFSAGSLTLSNTKNGAVIVNAAGLLPAGSANGSASITIQGSFSAAVILTGTGDGSALSQALTLKIEDTTGTAVTLWTGTMSSFTTVSLGTLASGTTRSYRFTVTFPAANATAALQNSSTTMTLRFTGVAQ